MFKKAVRKEGSGSGNFVGKLATIVLDTTTDYPGPMGAITYHRDGWHAQSLIIMMPSMAHHHHHHHPQRSP
eukprot:1810445-Rhodomonas_salina.1